MTLAVTVAALLAAGSWAAFIREPGPGPVDMEDAPEARPAPGCPERGACRGIDATTVRIGLHLTAGSCGTPVAVELPPTELGPGDWAAYVNRVQGGVHGRTIEVTLADDGGCRQGASEAARALEETGVLALGGVSGWEESAGAVSDAARRGTAYAGPGGPADWADMPVFHQGAAGFDVLFPALLRYIVGPAGLNRPEARIGVLYRDVPEVGGPALRSLVSVPAARVVATIPVGERGIETVSALRRLRQTEADVVVCHCPPGVLVPFVEAADAADYRPQYAFAAQGYDLDQVLAAFPPDSTFTANASGLSVFCHPEHPCAEPHRRALTDVRPGATLTQRSIRTIHLLDLLIEPLRRAGPSVDRVSYARHLASIDGWTTGLTGAVELSPDRSVGATAFAVYESPGPGATAWRMTDLAGRPFNTSWGA